ncbi:MAG: hypothetical protein LBC20_18020 [Planctomycetaceae bacterium]|nr:hypothetical protein [Planctomycetaceae bacterium]
MRYVFFCRLYDGKRIAIISKKPCKIRSLDNGKCNEMLRCVFGDFFSKNPDVKVGKSGKSGGGGHYVVESGERIAERVHVLNSFL